MLNLLEFEIEDIRRLLADLPTETVEKEVITDIEDLDDEGESTKREICVDVEVETFSPESFDRHSVVALVERIGEIYDLARARAIREAA
jgi:hypothetical protein